MSTLTIKYLSCGENMNTDFSGAQCDGKSHVLIKSRGHRAEMYLGLVVVHT